MLTRSFTSAAAGRGSFLAASFLALTAIFPVLADFQGSTHVLSMDDDVINYSKMPDTGPVAKLQKRIDSGEVKLPYDDRFGYLPAVLKELNVPVSGQMLVFSKTSFQRERIAPNTPRAVYVGDEAYVGFVQGSPLLEFSSVDPVLGAVFYTLEQKRAERPKFVRTDNCTECHASAKSMGVPGHLVRSFKCDESGVVDLLSGADYVNHRTPLTERWGGWYVTGKHGAQTHRGNLLGESAFARQEKEPNWRGTLTDLSPLFETSHYLKPGSDIVALMVMEHQAHMQFPDPPPVRGPSEDRGLRSCGLPQESGRGFHAVFVVRRGSSAHCRHRGQSRVCEVVRRARTARYQGSLLASVGFENPDV